MSADDESSTPPAPEAAVVYAPAAGFWRRFGAYVIDLLLGYPLSVMGAALGTLFTPHTGLTVSYILPTVLWMAYMVLMTGITGTTLGKKAMGIRVICRDGGPLNVLTAAVRYTPLALLSLLGAYNSAMALRGIDMSGLTSIQDWLAVSETMAAQAPLGQVPTIGSAIFYIVSIMMLSMDGLSRTLHDRLAGTVVVQMSHQALQNGTPPQSDVGAAPGVASTLPQPSTAQAAPPSPRPGSIQHDAWRPGSGEGSGH